MRSTVVLLLLFLALMLLFISCQKETSCQGCKDSNKPPIANAGPDQSIILPNDSILLDGRSSNDPDGSINSFLWTKMYGPASFTISNTASVTTVVKNLVAGIYEFKLKVTDAGALFSEDIVQIWVKADNYTVCNISSRPLIRAQLTQVGTLSEARVPAVAAVGSKIVFAGGLKEWVCGPDYGIASTAVDIYDIITHTWTTAQLSIPRWGISTAVLGNKIFFAGGENGQWSAYDNVDIYDVSTNTWTVAHLSEPRAFLAAATVGNKVFFAGGYDYPVPITSSLKVDIYDLSTNSWSTASLSVARSGISATTADNKIYFAGGASSSGGGIIDIYDLSTNSWSISNLQFLKGVSSAVAAGQKIYWPGAALIGQKYVAGIEIRDLRNNTTAFVDCISNNSWGGGSVLKNDDIVFYGGNQFDIYNTSTGKWSIGQLNQGINGGAVISVNNTIYVGGGEYVDNNGCLYFTNKVYSLNW